MKLRNSDRRNQALTLLEALVVVFLLSMLAVALLPALIRPPQSRGHLNCVNNLKQIGLAFRIWEGDNNDKYPMAVSATNGGAMEAAIRGNPMAVFQVMSNELSTPKILVCPADQRRWPAPSFSTPLSSSNISYFISLDSSETNPQDVLTGDDNLEIRGVRVKSGLLTISSNTPIAWTADRHGLSGNLGMADGSVQGANNLMLRNWLSSTNSATIRLAIP